MKAMLGACQRAEGTAGSEVGGGRKRTFSPLLQRK